MPETSHSRSGRPAAGPGGPTTAIHHLVAEQAALTPDAIAVTSGDEQISYRELVERAARTAARLRDLGVRPEDVVPVVAERSAGLVVALLGILNASAAYLALDPELPPGRAESMVQRVQRRVAFAPGGGSPLLTGFDAVIPMEDCGAGAGPAAPGASLVHPGQLAYVSYTSGSTGVPKGVCVPHRAVVRLVREPDWCSFGPGDAFLQLAPVAFDASTLEIWAPLTTGGRLVVMPPGPLDLDELAATLTGQRVTVLWLSAGLFSRFVDRHLAALGSVRHLLAGGDVVSAEHVRRLLAAHPGLAFTNGYGPTENTTFTACWTTREPPADTRALPIGHAISGTRVQLLRADLSLCGPGEVGEIHACGEGLARGYFAAPAATAARFLPDPHSPRPGERMYATGDLGRWTSAGELEFLGRVDRQVKIRGFRVEPGEIEAALLATGAVSEALVLAHGENGGDKQLAAFVVPAPAVPALAGSALAGSADPAGAATAAVRLRQDMATRLPAHMVPATVTLLDAFPLGPTGKIDRERLLAGLAPRSGTGPEPEPGPEPGPEPEPAQGAGPDVAELQARLSRLWARYLGIPLVAVDDDFFELGGHSLIAAELLDAVQRDFGVLVPARTLYLNPTVRELTAQIAARIPDSGTHTTKAEQPHETVDIHH